MPLIISETLYEMLERSRVGMWVEELVDGRVTLATKAPNNVVKAVYRGASCSLLICVIEVEQTQLLCLGLRIQDEADNPYVVMSPFVAPRNRRLVQSLLESASTGLYFFNELSHPALEAGCSLQPPAAMAALHALASTTPYSITSSSTNLGEILRKFDLALDRFQHRVYQEEDSPNHVVMYQTIPLTLKVREPNPVIEVSPTTQSTELKLDDDDEGGQLEQSLHVSIEAIYPESTFLSPKVGNRRRELVDILGVDHETEHICLLASKAMSVQSNLSKLSSRRASGVNKQIQKGLKQLCGAIDRIRDGDPIFDSQGQAISLPDSQDSLFHAIVLISEMYFFVNWCGIARQLAELSDKERYGALFHVLDLQELRYLGAYSGNPGMFNTLLVQHWTAVKEKGTAYVRARAPLLLE